jgi:peptidoglycan/LPS O-acetylase OafA/YrhL
MTDPYLRNLNEPITLVSSAINQTHYPSLNGLRGVSIIIVLMFHLHLSWNDSYFLFFNGPLGVNIFFVISGFLITTLCLKEKSLTGNLS